MKYSAASSNTPKSWNLFKYVRDPSKLSASEALCLLLIIFIISMFYLGWSDDKKKKRKEIVRSDVPKDDNSSVTTVGPYGGVPGQKFSFQCVNGQQRITKVIVKHGFIVDAIGLEVSDKSGLVNTVWFGGTGGCSGSEVELECDEYITQIAGEYGKYSLHYGQYSDADVITKLEISTNKRPFGCGTFGISRDVKGQIHQFRLSSPMPGHAITGLFGTFGGFLHSLGAYYSSPANDSGHIHLRS